MASFQILSLALPFFLALTKRALQGFGNKGSHEKRENTYKVTENSGKRLPCVTDGNRGLRFVNTPPRLENEGSVGTKLVGGILKHHRAHLLQRTRWPRNEKTSSTA